MVFFTPANLLTLVRVPLALGLLTVSPLSPAFFLLYVLSGVTDMLDGPVARRTHTESRTGAKLDSLADAVFLAAVLYRLLPVLHLSRHFLWTLALICLLRCGAWLSPLCRPPYPCKQGHRRGAVLCPLPAAMVPVPWSLHRPVPAGGTLRRRRTGYSMPVQGI